MAFKEGGREKVKAKLKVRLCNRLNGQGGDGQGEEVKGPERARNLP